MVHVQITMTALSICFCFFLELFLNEVCGKIVNCPLTNGSMYVQFL